MMIGHLSDTHLGACIRSEPEMENDYYEAFSEAVDTFIREHVDIVIHSGDILDEPRTYGTPIKILLQEVRRLRERDIPFLFTLGEHDIASIPTFPIPLLLEQEGLGTYLGDGEPRRVKGVVVAGLHKFRKIEERDLTNRLLEISQNVRNLEGKKILVLHQGVREAGGPAGEISINSIPAGFDYYAMGHLHIRYGRRHGPGFLHYPGPTHWVSAEDPEECGVALVDLSGDEPDPGWVRLGRTRPKIKLEAGYEQLEKILSELLSKQFERKPCLWLDVKTDKPFDTHMLESRLGEKFIIKRVRTIIQAPEKTYSHVADLHLDVELRRLAAEALGSSKMVDYFLGEMLQLLASGNVKEACESVWRIYREGSWR